MSTLNHVQSAIDGCLFVYDNDQWQTPVYSLRNLETIYVFLTIAIKRPYQFSRWEDGQTREPDENLQLYLQE